MIVTRWHDAVPTPLLILVGGSILAWHGSLQHETIHGHPTGSRSINTTVGFIPLSLWLPYALYRRSHVAHHNSESITNPLLDPESRYVEHGRSIAWLAARAQSTLPGHIVLGPPIAIVRTLAQELKRVGAKPAHVARDWIPHLLAAAILMAWLNHVGLSLGNYLLFFVYPGMALTTLRSHAEHRAEFTSANRAASVESRGPLALLFLNNSLHAAHHERPGLAWYRLPAYHMKHRARLVDDHNTLYTGYAEVFQRFAWRSHDASVHPSFRTVGT